MYRNKSGGRNMAGRLMSGKPNMAALRNIVGIGMASLAGVLFLLGAAFAQSAPPSLPPAAPAAEPPTAAPPLAQPATPETLPGVDSTEIPPGVVEGEPLPPPVIAAEPIIGRLAILRGLDKVTGRTVDFRAPIGQKVRFKSLILEAKGCEKAAPESLPEVSIYVEVDEAARQIARPHVRKGANSVAAQPEISINRIFSGWLFASSPGLSAIEHPVYDVWAIDCRI